MERNIIIANMMPENDIYTFMYSGAVLLAIEKAEASAQASGQNDYTFNSGDEITITRVYQKGEYNGGDTDNDMEIKNPQKGSLPEISLSEFPDQIPNDMKKDE